MNRLRDVEYTQSREPLPVGLRPHYAAREY